MKPRDLLVGDVAGLLTALALVDGQRARPDEAHLALPDVEQLGELVKRGRAEHPTHASDSRVIRGRLDGNPGGIRVRDHGSELQDTDPLLMLPPAIL